MSSADTFVSFSDPLRSCLWAEPETLKADSQSSRITRVVRITGGHYVFGQISNHCSRTLCDHIDMKSGMHDQCSSLFLGAEVHHHRSTVSVRSTRALSGPHHDCSRHLLLKESLDNAILATRLLIRVDFPFSYMLSLLHCTQ